MVQESEIEVRAKEIAEQAEVDLEVIKHELTQMVTEFHVDIDTATEELDDQYTESSVSSNSLQDALDEYRESTDPDPDVWVDSVVEVTKIHGDTADVIAQKGYIGDETIQASFIKFKGDNSDLPPLEEGCTYQLAGGVVDTDQNDNLQIKFTSATEIDQTDASLDTAERSSNSVRFTGRVLDFQTGSGIIQRCPECDRNVRALADGGDARCDEHGAVNTNIDLRLMLRMDNGKLSPIAYLQKDTIEELFDMSLRDALCLAVEGVSRSDIVEAYGSDFTPKEALIEANGKYSNEPVLDELGSELLGQNLSVEGPDVSDDDEPHLKMAVNTATDPGYVTSEEVEQLLVNVRS